MVLQLASGINEAYKHVGINIRHAKPLPPFSEARFSLLLEERELAAMAMHGGSSAMVEADEVAASTDGSGSLGSHRNKNRKNNRHHSGNKNRRGGRNSDGGKGGSGSGGGRHGGGRNSGGGQGSAAPQLGSWQWVPNYTPPPPPCPIPAQGWARPATGPTRSSGQQGVLVPHPQHVYAVLAPTGSYVQILRANQNILQAGRISSKQFINHIYIVI